MAELGNKCYFCALEYNGTNAPVFEFHHVNPSEKDAGITRIVANLKWEKVLTELLKCVMTCANCHNQHHGGKW